ncbi:hypothetical protein ACN28S_33695 [Cystobacter fuscus]
MSKGYLCQKAARLQHYQESADRLEHPLRREPDGSFVRVGWDEALADIAGASSPSANGTAGGRSRSMAAVARATTWEVPTAGSSRRR